MRVCALCVITTGAVLDLPLLPLPLPATAPANHCSALSACHIFCDRFSLCSRKDSVKTYCTKHNSQEIGGPYDIRFSENGCILQRQI